VGEGDAEGNLRLLVQGKKSRSGQSDVDHDASKPFRLPFESGHQI
jgi:hypothetical protein